MSNTESSILSRYNSLLDKNLSGYFSNTKMRKHLVKSGMINRDGRITSENTYRMKMAKKEHRDNVRDLLASAIVDKALDMERMRRYEIRKRLEELYKIELVQKVRSERGKRVNDDLVALLTPRKKSSKHRKSKSAAVTKTEKKDTKLPNIHFEERSKKIYYENPESSNSNSAGSLPDHSQPIPPSDKKKLHPHPPPGKSKKKKRNIHRGLMLAKSDQMIAHRVQLQSMAEVTMKYLGSPLNLTNDIFPSNKLSEVQIIQQHCGASTICVFRELLPANTLFTFVSRRHRGSPFGLTIYINGIQNIRISSCCEYKHKPGHKVGGKNSQFGLVAVQGAAPCYRCQIRLNLINGNKTTEKEDQASSSDEESAVKSYDIIVSRAGRHSESQMERPVSASVMTQTIDDNDVEEDNKVEENIEETNDYQDEEFEEDAQFALNQEELSSDNEIISSTHSSESESEDDKKEAEEHDSYSLSKSSDSDKAEHSSDRQEEDKADKVEENKKNTDGSSDSGDTSSTESEKSIENEVYSEHEKSSEVEESSEAEKPNESSEEKPTDISDQDDDKEILSHITIEKDGSSDDESTLSASSKSSSNSGSDNEQLEDLKDKNDSDETADSIKDDDNENEKNSETDAVISDKASQPEVTDQDNDSDNEVADTSDVSDNEIPQDDDDGKYDVKEEENDEDHSKINDQEIEQDKLVISDEDDEQLGKQNEEEGNELSNVDSDSDAERAVSVVSRESTMLTGNEDGNCDAANKTIHFNEEVDVVTYAKAEGTSTEEETPRSDDSEGEFDTVNIAGGNVILADLGDAGDDGDISDLVNKTEDIEINSDEDEGDALNSAENILNALSISDSGELEADESEKPEKRVFKEGSIDSFVDSWRNVVLENLYLTENQTNELISAIEEKKDDIVDFSLKNTVIDGGIEILKDALKQVTNLKALNLSRTNMGPEEVEHLVDVLLDGTHKIETLILHGNPINDEGTSILTTGVTRLKSLKSLDLSECKVSDDGADALFDYLSENTTLTDLTLSSNEFNLEGWRYIASALKVNSTLTVLVVDSNDIGDEGIKVLCNGIKQNKSLVTLDIRNNSLNDDGGDALYDAIEKCTTLRNVTIMPNNLFSEEKQKKLYELLDMKNS